MFKFLTDPKNKDRSQQTSWPRFAKRTGKIQKAAGAPERPLRVLVVGGGPVGLAFATSLDVMMGRRAQIAVCDARWIRRRGRIVWKGEGDGVTRREQVVTLQSRVLSRLPEAVRTAIFASGRTSEVWPLGTGSPPNLGFPRNIAIRDVEDGLLDLARARGLELLAERFDAGQAETAAYDLIAICDGPASRTREHFASLFGAGDPVPFSLDGRQVEDVVLGLRVKARIPDPDGVLLTVAQNRFLLNTHLGEGMLYMRLTPDETQEVRGRPDKGAGFAPCIQSAPCVMAAVEGGFRCPTHGTRFVPAEDPNSFLWPRIREGLRLFDVPLENFRSVTAFRLSMVRRNVFTAELTPIGQDRPVFGALVGDAAIGLSFWPGRGMNTGLSGAVALARTLAARRGDQYLRAADLVPFEAAMAALARRNQEPAWRSMVVPFAGRTVPVREVIAKVLSDHDETDRAAFLSRLGDRLRGLSERLAPRLPSPPDPETVIERLGHLETETLAVFDVAGAWETKASGGPEVDLDRIVPAALEEPEMQPHLVAS